MSQQPAACEILTDVPIAQVRPWDRNPRTITPDDLQRLKGQISRLGVYKPLIAAREADGFTVLGGNMRLRALKELGATHVTLSVVPAQDDAQRLEYALSDNDRAGSYEESQLAALVREAGQLLDAGLFSIDLGQALPLPDLGAMQDLDGVLEGAFGKAVSERENGVSVTFVFKEEDRPLIEAALRKHKRTYWADRMAELMDAEGHA
ncbi:MAG: hypothetical protein FJW69_10275 [Actinobacteria bacterium]|nr:hypothetical protein [Actinomycetota bacterium]